MFPLRSENDVLNMINKISRRTPTDMRYVAFVMENHDKIFKYNSPTVIYQLWMLAKKDFSATIALLGAGYNMLPTYTGMQYDSLIRLAYQATCKQMCLGLKKVNMMLIFIQLLSKTMALNIETHQGSLVISTNLKETKLMAMAEVFPLASLSIFKNELIQILNDSKKLNDYHLATVPCKNEQLDDLISITKIAKQRGFEKVRINSLEKSEKKSFNVALIKNQFQEYQCIITFTTEYTSKLMNQNPFRRYITDQTEINNYLTHLQGLYKNNLKKSCIKHGMRYDRKYRVAFKTDNPGIESCSLSCLSQSKNYVTAINKQNHIKLPACLPRTLTTNFSCVPFGTRDETPCLFWSFDLKTQDCFLMTKQADINELYSYHNYKTAVTGSVDCQHDLMPQEVFIKIHNKTVNAFEHCLFSGQRFDNIPLPTRCAMNAREIERPLETLLNQLIYFTKVFNATYQMKLSHRFKRNIAPALLQTLKKIAISQAPNIVNSLISGFGKSSKQILELIQTKLKNAGLQTNKITERSLTFQHKPFNYTQVAQYFDTLQEISLKGEQAEKIKTIDRLSSEFFRLKNYFLELMTGSAPILQRTKDFIKNKNYVFSSHLKNDDIIRYFFVTKQNERQTTRFVTVFPYNYDNFGKQHHYQQGILSESNNNNECLRKILQNYNMQDLVATEICFKQEVKRFTKNIIIAQHALSQENVTIIAIKDLGFIELYCKNFTQMLSTSKLIILAVPQTCTVKINDLQVQTPIDKASKFKPQILYQESAKSSTRLLAQPWVIGLIGLATSTIIIISALCLWKRVGQSRPKYFISIKRKNEEPEENIKLRRM